MNKVIVTGLGLGNDFGVCSTCNLNFSWVIEKPSVLIWADKIVITQNAWDYQTKTAKDKFNKAINIVLEIMETNGLIEIVKPSKLFTPEVKDNIYQDAKRDIENLLTQFESTCKKGDKKVPDEIIIEKNPYCGPYIASIYASLKLSEKIDANCLFNQRDYNFLKYKYGLQTNSKINYNAVQAMNEIFTLYFPNELVLHNYAFTSDKKCKKCERIQDCSKKYLIDIEKNTNEILKWKNYDEISRAKEELNKVIKNKKHLNQKNYIENIKKEYIEKQNKINKNIKKIFPSVKRWTNLATIVAAPLTVYSVISKNPTTLVASASIIGISKLLEESMKYYENNNSWVGFINKVQ